MTSVGDINQDGFGDFAVTEYTGGGYMKIYLGAPIISSVNLVHDNCAPRVISAQPHHMDDTVVFALGECFQTAFVSVYNMQGQILVPSEIELQVVDGSARLNLQTLALTPGFYNARIRTGTGTQDCGILVVESGGRR